MKPKIAVVTNIITPFRKTFYEKLCSDHRFEWMVAFGMKPRQDGRPAYAGDIKIPQRYVVNIEKNLGPYTICLQQDALRVVREVRPDVTVLVGIAGNITTWLILAWSKLTGRKTVLWTCGWEKQRPGSLPFLLKRMVLRLFFGLADHHLVYSSKGARYVQELGIPANKATICFNGIDVEPLLEKEAEIRRAARELRSLNRLDGKKVFLYAGAMMPEKNVDLLLQAFTLVSERNGGPLLWLVGDGPELAGLQRQAAELGLGDRCRFWGRIDEPDAHFAAADFFVMPGTGGVALNQAMFWGTPCICSEADGTEEDLVIDGLTGKRFSPGDKVSLAVVMEECLHIEDDEINRWRAVSRELITSRSNVDTMVKTFGETLCRLTGKKGIAA